MWDRVLVAMDEFETGQAALALGAGLARESGASVVVLHVREVSPLCRGAQLLTSGEAGRLVEEAATSLRASGIDATGVLSVVRQNRVAPAIAAAADKWECDAIVLGSSRRTGLHRLVGGGTRERVLRRSPTVVLTAPAPLRVTARVPAHPPVETREPQR